MCRLWNKAMRDYQESVITEQTNTQTDRQTYTGQSYPYVPLCFAGDTKNEFMIQFYILEVSFVVKYILLSIITFYRTLSTCFQSSIVKFY